MGKVEEVILSGKYDAATCQNLIAIISNVPGDSNCALIFFETIQKMVDNLDGTPLLDALMNPIIRALVKMTIKVPLLYESTIEFLQQEQQFSLDLQSEAIYCLSRQYQIQADILKPDL